MRGVISRLVFLLSAACFCFIFSGCSGALLSTPSSSLHIDAGSMKRSDYVVLDRVEGSSTTIKILLGLIQVIDDDKVKILGMPLYEEKYAFQRPPETNLFTLLLFGLGGGPDTADRAYYKALAATPDADCVLNKSFSDENRSVLFFYSTETVRFTGKAIRLKTDKEL
jgi:hypothetical protein